MDPDKYIYGSSKKKEPEVKPSGISASASAPVISPQKSESAGTTFQTEVRIIAYPPTNSPLCFRMFVGRIMRPPETTKTTKKTRRAMQALEKKVQKQQTGEEG